MWVGGANKQKTFNFVTDNGPAEEGLVVSENFPYLLQCPVTCLQMDLASPDLITSAVWSWAPGYSGEAWDWVPGYSGEAWDWVPGNSGEAWDWVPGSLLLR